MSDDGLDAQIWRQQHALAARVQPVVTKYTICVYALQDTLKAAGTGVLLQVADHYFLLSAAHVLDFTFYHKLQFYASVDASGFAPPIPLLFVKRRASARSTYLSTQDPTLRDDDPLDISVALFERDTALALGARHRFLQIGDLDAAPLKKGSGIYVFGYLEALTEATETEEGCNLETFPLGYVTTPLQHEPEARDKRKDILLYYDEHSVTAFGKPAIAPKPKGMSGCGIWRMVEPPMLPDEAFANQVRLVGIQHRWRSKSRYLVGTSIARVLALIHGAYPELRPALNLIRL